MNESDSSVDFGKAGTYRFITKNGKCHDPAIVARGGSVKLECTLQNLINAAKEHDRTVVYKMSNWKKKRNCVGFALAMEKKFQLCSV